MLRHEKCLAVLAVALVFLFAASIALAQEKPKVSLLEAMKKVKSEQGGMVLSGMKKGDNYYLIDLFKDDKAYEVTFKIDVTKPPKEEKQMQLKPYTPKWSTKTLKKAQTDALGAVDEMIGRIGRKKAGEVNEVGFGVYGKNIVTFNMTTVDEKGKEKFFAEYDAVGESVIETRDLQIED